MAWTILTDPDFADWFASEPQGVRKAITDRVAYLAVEGPQLGRPIVDTLHGTSLENLKELRVPVKGNPYRVLFAFDPRRQAILLVGGNKGADRRWYKIAIPIAERRFARHIERLEAEGEGTGEEEP